MNSELSKNNSRHVHSLQQLWPTHKRHIHVYETDKDGVVHFSNYLRIAEEAIFAGFRKLGFPVESDGNSMVMLDINVNYQQPIRFGDSVEVILAAIKAKRVKLFLELNFYCNDSLCTKMKLTFASIASGDKKVIPLSIGLRSALSNISM